MFNLPLWRDISVVLLAVELIIGLVPVLVLLFFCIKYVPQGIRWIRKILNAIRQSAESIRYTTLNIGHSIISPFITIQQYIAAGKGMARAALSIMRGR